jgi:hypothetical protein
MACIKAEKAIRARLKAPSTARFDYCYRYEVRATPDRTGIYVKGYVDAQNSFGAMLRKPFVVRFKRNDDQWTVVAAVVE